MPDITFSQALTANQVGFRPLQNWRFRRLPYRAQVSILARATTAGVRVACLAGTTEVWQVRSQVQGGGTAAVTPVPTTTPVISFIGEAGDEIDLAFDEVAAGAPTLDGWVSVDPV